MKAGVSLLVSMLILLAACSSCGKKQTQAELRLKESGLDKILVIEGIEDEDETFTSDEHEHWCAA